MRILTNSPFNSKGLISVSEATEDAPQKIIFCIPLDNYEAKRINTLSDFRQYFRKGITTKIKDSTVTKTIDLDFHSNARLSIGRTRSLPSFTASVKRREVDFYLSRLNFLNYDSQSKLNFDFFYDGRIFNKLLNKKFVILEPDWKQLDKLFIEEQVLFSDWE